MKKSVTWIGWGISRCSLPAAVQTCVIGGQGDSPPGRREVCTSLKQLHLCEVITFRSHETQSGRVCRLNNKGSSNNFDEKKSVNPVTENITDLLKWLLLYDGFEAKTVLSLCLALRTGKYRRDINIALMFCWLSLTDLFVGAMGPGAVHHGSDQL